MNIKKLDDKIKYQEYFQFSDKDWKNIKNYNNKIFDEDFFKYFKSKIYWQYFFNFSANLNKVKIFWKYKSIIPISNVVLDILNKSDNFDINKFILVCYNKINWYTFFNYFKKINIDEIFMKKYYKIIDFNVDSFYMYVLNSIQIDILVKYHNCFNWDKIVQYYNITEEFCKKCYKFLNNGTIKKYYYQFTNNMLFEMEKQGYKITFLDDYTNNEITLKYAKNFTNKTWYIFIQNNKQSKKFWTTYKDIMPLTFYVKYCPFLTDDELILYLTNNNTKNVLYRHQKFSLDFINKHLSLFNLNILKQNFNREVQQIAKQFLKDKNGY